MTIDFAIKLTVPGKPPAKSNNYRVIRVGRFHRIVPTKEVVEYEQMIALLASRVVQNFTDDVLYPDPQRVEMAIIWHRSNKRRADLDNIAKAINDGLTKGRIWSDDKQVVVLHMSMLFGKNKEDWVEIYIGPMEDI